MSLPGDSFKDRALLDWIIADKSGESTLVDDFQDLLIKQQELSTKHGQVGKFDLLVSNGDLAVTSIKDSSVEMQI